mgnify:CR=1 FL=1
MYAAATTRYLADLAERTGRAGIFLANGAWKCLAPPYRLSPVVKQVHFIGARSLLVITVSGLFVGMVVALQFHDTLVRFGAVGLLGAAVTLAIVSVSAVGSLRADLPPGTFPDP